MSNIKEVVLFSGGLDSTVLLNNVIRTCGDADKVVALHFQYGQRHSVEAKAARNIADYFNVRLTEVDLVDAGRLMKSSLTQKTIDDVKTNTVVVPNRNAIMLSIAHGYAYSIGAKTVWFGAHKGDYEVFPDCRENFFVALRDVLTLGLVDIEASPKINTPFLHMSKGEIIKQGIAEKAPINLTWTCYDPQKVTERDGKKTKIIHVPCGTCLSCTERRKAFEEIGVIDIH